MYKKYFQESFIFFLNKNVHGTVSIFVPLSIFFNITEYETSVYFLSFDQMIQTSEADMDESGKTYLSLGEIGEVMTEAEILV